MEEKLFALAILFSSIALLINTYNLILLGKKQKELEKRIADLRGEDVQNNL